MKHIFLISLLILGISCSGQTENNKKLTVENFDVQILKYEPVKNEFNKKTYEDGLRFLDETKKRIIKNKGLDISDYWNILTVFNNMKESNENIDIAFEKFSNNKNSCEYLISFEELFNKYSKYLEYKMANRLTSCKNSNQTKNIETFNIKEYSTKSHLDENLVQLIREIGIDDQKDRNNNKLQKQLDIRNQVKIDSLYKDYQTYLGKSLVGNEFKSVMWQVIQHSNLNYMEKYLPIVISAVKNNELGESALKYLIDRIYSEKHNYQIFGSQENIKIADEKTRKEIKLKYGME